MPKTYSFSGQRKDEVVKYIVKGSPWQLFPALIQFVLLIALSVVFTAFSGWQYLVIALLAIIMVAFVIVSRAIYCFIQTTTIVTNQRVVNVAQRGFWTVIITESELVNIKEITTVKKGFISYITNTGDVILSTNAGDGGVIAIQQILNPYELQQKIAQAKRPN